MPVAAVVVVVVVWVASFSAPSSQAVAAPVSGAGVEPVVVVEAAVAEAEAVEAVGVERSMRVVVRRRQSAVRVRVQRAVRAVSDPQSFAVLVVRWPELITRRLHRQRQQQQSQWLQIPAVSD